MKPEPSVQIREQCEGCDGAGTQRVGAGTGHVSWGKRVPCPDCDGTGQRARWIPLSEFRALLNP